jgi:Ser/Thr protein kinase RdoA (MazF antagonist)
MESTLRSIEEILGADLVHPDCRDDFQKLCRGTTERIAPLFEGARLQRIHGDCHRGNILERPGEGLIIIDFDDMMTGPPVQDLWLLLPGYAEDCRRELVMILDGYEEWTPFDRSSLRLIEPLRFMRMIYFLAWCARQRHDRRFRIDFPQWGTESFWIKELEDLRNQVQVIDETLAG